ncbi:MAG TPA: PAS domain S-box protein [Actinomycetota bacterium]|nr:PAS domain S-box protein [Actinomycetota bacterium]
MTTDVTGGAGRRNPLPPPPANEGGEGRLVAQLRMLHSLGAKLNQLNDVRRIGAVITGELRELIDYHNCRVYLLGEDGETLVPIAFRGTLSEYEGETFEALVTTLGRGITGHVAATGEPYYSPNALEDPHAQQIPGTTEIVESILAVPLLYRERVVGVIVLSKLGVDQFDASDLRLLEVLASHAAAALENARLLEAERRAAERLRESEARKTAILESALDCVVVIDHEGRIVEFNPAAERTFGYRKEEVLGRELAEVLIPPPLRTRHREGLRRYLETGESRVLGRRLEVAAMRADGTEFPVEVAISRVALPGVPLFTGYIRDISERKRAEAEVERALRTEREAIRRLQALDEMKNTFLQAVSHDVRTPLSAILGLALTLEREDLDLPLEERRDLARRLAANARKLERIVSNMLDLDRLTRGVVALHREPTRVDALARQVVGEAEFLAQREVRVDTDPVVAEVDPPKVERILENLLVNAARHTPAGTPVWVRVRGHDEGCLITVEDAGPGVPEDLRQAVFEPFRRASLDQPSPGTGIGLSLVARFAELHGGRAWVEERSGGGASFRVWLPGTGSSGPHAPAGGPARGPAGTEGAGDAAPSPAAAG